MLEPHLGPHNSSVLHDTTHHAFSRNALRSKCKSYLSQIVVKTRGVETSPTSPKT